MVSRSVGRAFRYLMMGAAALALALAAGCSRGAAPGSAGAQKGAAGGGAPVKAVKFGAVFILSGNGAAYGTSQKNGLELAREEINAAGGVDGARIDIVYEDSAGDKNQAINAVNKLINTDQVLAIIGPTLSAEMFAAGPVANQLKVPIMGVSNTAKGITAIGPYVFRNSLPEERVIPVTVKRAKEKYNLKRVALMYAKNDDFSVSGAETFKKAFQDNGIQLVATETFNTGDQDFGAQLAKVAAAKPDAVALSCLYNEGALILTQMRQRGMDLPVMGGNGFNSPQVVKIAGKAAEGLMVGSPWYPKKDDPKTKAFVEAYTRKYGKPPDQFAAQAYDGLGLFAEALRKAGPNPTRDAFRDALASIRNYHGVTGDFSFDENRDPVMQPTILQIRNGEYVEAN